MAADDDYNHCARELEDAVVRRGLLPPEILLDIGIVAADDAAETSSKTIAATRSRPSLRGDTLVEVLAAHLVGILGLTAGGGSGGGMGEKRVGAAPPPSATSYSQCHPHAHRPHVRPAACCGAGGGRNGGLMQQYHVPGFGTRQRLEAPPTLVPPAAPSSCAGTGVFLPRAEVYLTRASNPPGPWISSGAKPPRLLRKEAAMAIKQQRVRQLVQASAREYRLP